MDTRVRLGRVPAAYAIAVWALVTAPARGADTLDDARATIATSRSALLAKLDAAKANSDDAYDIVFRIDEAASSLDPVRAATDAAYVMDTALRVQLDAELSGGMVKTLQ